MSRYGFQWLVIMAVFAAIPVPSTALFTGLIQIPTADCLPPGQYELQLQWNGRFDSLALNGCLATTQFGLVPRVEAGLDFNLTPHTGQCAFGNVKYLFATNAKGTLEAAVGMYTVTTELEGTPYVVVTADLGGFDATVGGSRIADANRWLLGYQQNVSDRFTLVADYISGSLGYVALGIQYNFNDRSNLLVAGLAANEAEGDTLLEVQFSLFGPFSLD